MGQQADAEERDACSHVVYAFGSNNGSGDSDWCGRAQLRKKWNWFKHRHTCQSSHDAAKGDQATFLE